MERRLADLRDQLEHEKQNREAVEARLQRLQSESEAQAIVVAALEDQLLAARRTQEEMEATSREVAERLDAACQERDRERNRRIQLQRGLEGLDLEAVSAEQLLSERSQLRRQLTETSGRVEQLQQYCDRLTSEKEKAQRLEAQGRSETRGGSALLSARLIEARGQITELEAEKSALLAAKELVNQQLDQLKKQVESVREQVKEERQQALEREGSLEQEVQRLKDEMSEGAFAEMTARQENLENQLREQEVELGARAKAVEQAGRERRRLEDLLQDKQAELEQLERQATKLTEKAEKSDARREEAVRELAHIEAAYRAVQAQLEQRFTKPTEQPKSPTRKGPRPLWAGLAGVVLGVLVLLAAQQLGLIPDQLRFSEALRGTVSEPHAAAEPPPPRLTENTPADTRAVAPSIATTSNPTTLVPPLATSGTLADTRDVEEPYTEPSLEAVPPVSPERQTSVQTALEGTVSDGGPLLVGVPGGVFQMGYSRDTLTPEETPVHQVQIPAFYIGRYEVTFAEYDRFARATGRDRPDDEGWGRGQRPVVNISWDDAQAYVAWLSGRTGKRYRLPSEAEWEYAARAGTEGFYWWGYEIGTNNANCFDCGSQWDNRSTAPVGSFEENPFGLKDTAGNVMEWVADCYHNSYHGAPIDGSAWTSGVCSERVARGGAYNKPARSMHVSRRSGFSPDTRLGFIGFRVVREP